MMRNFWLAGVSASVLAFGSPGASAQDTDQDIVAEDVIVVTAQFREQTINEVPLAVTAYGGEFLDDLGITEFDELSNFVPGLLVQEQSVNNPGFVIRGITSDSGAANIEPRVSVFQNGVSVSRSRGSVVQLYDLERVEVLKGPQGTLFGRSAQIGAVHVITQKPTFDVEGYIGGEIGNFNQRAVEGGFNLPLIEDMLAFRMAGTFERRTGYQGNSIGEDLNGTDSYSVRASLRFQPTDTFTADLIGHYAKDTPPGTSFKSGVIPALGGTADPNDFASLSSFGGLLGGRDLSVDRNLWDITGILNWKISDALAVTSTTAYREFESFEVFDPDGTAIDILVFGERAAGDQVSSDIRFSYDNGGKFTGFFGGGVFFETGSQNVPLGFNAANTGALQLSFAGAALDSDGSRAVISSDLGLAIVPPLLSGDPAQVSATIDAFGLPTDAFQEEFFTNSSDNFSFDVFAEVSYELTDRLELTLGGRYTRDDKESLYESGGVLLDPFTPILNGIAAPGSTSPFLAAANSGGVLSSNDFPVANIFDGFAWRGVLNYEFSDGRYVYFNYSRGRRPEVIQDQFAPDLAGDISGGFVVVPAETVDSYEVGLKGEFLDGLFAIESAAYYYTYKNFQTTVFDGIALVTVNGGNARAYGAELGLTVDPSDNLDVFITYGYNNARFNDEDDAGNPQEFGGNRFRLSPDHSLSAGFTYEQPTKYGDFFVTPTYTWRSEVFFENDNQGTFDVFNPVGDLLYTVPTTSQDAYGLFNIRAGVNLLDGRLTLEGYAENLFDKEYVLDAGNTGGTFGVPTFIAGPPRFYGGGFTLRY
ncbi:MAG: TonB-dependent receptor [Pseudomonadota bacterium]